MQISTCADRCCRQKRLVLARAHRSRAAQARPRVAAVVLPYSIVCMVTGSVAAASQKKYELEKNFL